MTEMLWQVLHIIDITLWLPMAYSTAYVFVFAMVCLLHKRTPVDDAMVSPTPSSRFLILMPAYKEDRVIISSADTFLGQDYPKELYQLAVISDHMSEATNAKLRLRPLQLLTPTFKQGTSTKAKALQYAVSKIDTTRFDQIVILDADNVVSRDFLTLLNHVCQKGYKAIQCHRCAKNSDSNIAVLDGISEEINNTVFRKAHNYIGLSSALIGSGMCFDARWFSEHADKLSTAGEDRELENLLLQQKIFIKYAAHIPVYDEKVSNQDNFQQQRLRWMSAQLQSLLSLLPQLPRAIRSGNINLIDKTLQQALIPRSILLVGTLFLAVATLLFVPVWSAKWWILFLILLVSLVIAIPSQLRSKAARSHIFILPHLVWKMLTSLHRLDRNNKNFIHTSHNK